MTTDFRLLGFYFLKRTGASPLAWCEASAVGRKLDALDPRDGAIYCANMDLSEDGNTLEVRVAGGFHSLGRPVNGVARLTTR